MVRSKCGLRFVSIVGSVPLYLYAYFEHAWWYGCPLALGASVSHASVSRQYTAWVDNAAAYDSLSVLPKITRRNVFPIVRAARAA